jgi:hypothetical protein
MLHDMGACECITDAVPWVLKTNDPAAFRKRSDPLSHSDMAQPAVTETAVDAASRAAPLCICVRTVDKKVADAAIDAAQLYVDHYDKATPLQRALLLEVLKGPITLEPLALISATVIRAAQDKDVYPPLAAAVAKLLVAMMRDAEEEAAPTKEDA